ncbi:YeeE/YedE family protein [Rhizobium ecuadorense]|uniref:YeeE/YedE family protein n=1 Tax=Rhizobium ecuadorense TaxID=1671795 RepID=UPI0006733762|nr:YeeE/YedE family protein [Rhizobium ecuadorense]
MNLNLRRSSAAFASGIVFGFGLSLSGMLDPVRVQGFLDIFGAWDPSLAFVLGGAVIVTFIGVQAMKRMTHPAFDDSFHVPENREIDAPLVVGSTLFGLGWGIGGFCPGPAVASLSIGLPQTVLLVAAMLVGMTLHDRVWNRRP